MTWYIIKDDRASSDREEYTVASFQTEQEADQYLNTKKQEYLKLLRRIAYYSKQGRKNAKRSFGYYWKSLTPSGLILIDNTPSNS